MKNKLISLLQELIITTDKTDLVNLKASIMQKTVFLARPETSGEIGNIMHAVNSYIELPNANNIENVEKVIKRLNDKF
ncbi:hypothetical protein [Flavobacterium denitrificans]|uniref:hypothetical protein n=1 Tax=Flavobacterium denitrificans TaxID=281361 RepID=UPI00047BD091|nr:hypothetical protein [Flavobacterium denitrificans]